MYWITVSVVWRGYMAELRTLTMAYRRAVDPISGPVCRESSSRQGSATRLPSQVERQIDCPLLTP
jgi:hypothetical protein